MLRSASSGSRTCSSTFRQTTVSNFPCQGCEAPRVLEIDAGHLQVGLAQREVLQVVEIVRD